MNMRLLARLWSEQEGAIISAEIMLVGTLLVIGVIVGLKSVRDSVVTELADVAEAMSRSNQTYWYNGHQNKHGGASGTSYNDNPYDNNRGHGHGPACVDTAAAAFGQG